MATATVAPRWGETLFSGLTFKVLLTTSAYTFNVDTHRYRSSVTNEISATGYTAGGATADTSVAYDTATDTVTVALDADITWTSSAISNARKAVVYVSTGSASADPIVGVITFDEDESSTGDGVFTVTAADTGLITFQAA